MKKLLRCFMLVLIAAMFMFTAAGVAAAEVKQVKGQTLYIPYYTSFIGHGRDYNLKATTYIHNTDRHSAISITKIDYYSTSGKLVEKHLQQPLKLNPLAATRITVKEPLRGEEGTGAHLLIQWQADNKVTEPLIEGVFIGSEGTHGYSFSSKARVIQEDAN